MIKDKRPKCPGKGYIWTESWTTKNGKLSVKKFWAPPYSKEDWARWASREWHPWLAWPYLVGMFKK